MLFDIKARGGRREARGMRRKEQKVKGTEGTKLTMRCEKPEACCTNRKPKADYLKMDS